MRRKLERTIGIVTASLFLSLFAGSADAADCRRVVGRLSIELVFCDDSVIGLCAEARIRGSSPITGTYRFAPKEFALGAGLATADPNTLSLVDDIEIHTRRGTLKAEKVGLFNQASGETVATYQIYEGAYTGVVVASGFFDLNRLHGDGLIGGRVCKNE